MQFSLARLLMRGKVARSACSRLVQYETGRGGPAKADTVKRDRQQCGHHGEPGDGPRRAQAAQAWQNFNKVVGSDAKQVTD
jgi:hypothetical protein